MFACALFLMGGVASASDWTIESSMGPIIYTDYTVKYGYREQKVACYKPRNMCYTESTMLSSFNVKIADVEAEYIATTGKLPVWRNLREVLRAR